jgi:hypothetical protein
VAAGLTGADTDLIDAAPASAAGVAGATRLLRQPASRPEDVERRVAGRVSGLGVQRRAVGVGLVVPDLLHVTPSIEAGVAPHADARRLPRTGHQEQSDEER